MARTKSKSHTHKYYRGWLGAERVWVCALPDCTHYLPKVMDTHINNRASLCWECEDQFQMNPLSMGEERPTCDDCRKINLGFADTENITMTGEDLKEYLKKASNEHSR